MIDYTALLKKLTPDRDGEPHTHLRTGTVDAVNANGTVDVLMSGGIIVPNIPKLTTADVSDGSVVQMISFRGSLLVLGPTSEPDPATLILKGQAGTVLVSNASTTSFNFNASFTEPFATGVVPVVMLNIQDGNAATLRWKVKAHTISNTGFTILAANGNGAAATAWSNIPVQWLAVNV